MASIWDTQTVSHGKNHHLFVYILIMYRMQYRSSYARRKRPAPHRTFYDVKMYLCTYSVMRCVFSRVKRTSYKWENTPLGVRKSLACPGSVEVPSNAYAHTARSTHLHTPWESYATTCFADRRTHTTRVHFVLNYAFTLCASWLSSSRCVVCRATSKRKK